MSSNTYWISNVGGECYVGRSDVYEGNEYILPTDDDTDERQYSTLAALWDDEETSSSLEGTGEDKTYLAIKRSEDAITRMKANIAKVKAKGNTALVKQFTGLLATMQKNHAALLKIPGAIALLKRKEAEGKAAKAKKGKSSGNILSSIAKGAVSLGGDIVHGLNSVAALPSKAVKGTLGQLPMVGAPIQAAMKLTPEAALGGLTSRVMAGERLDKAFLKAGREQIRAAREVAPYVQTVMTFVPGVGTGVAAAIAAGTALSEGRTISDIVLKSLRGAVPGGQLGQIAFDATLAVTSGKRLDKAALAIALKQLPPNVRQAADIALAAAKGKNPKDAVLQALRKALPSDIVRKAADIGTAVGVAKTIQSVVVNRVVSKPAIELLAKDGAKIAKKLPLLRAATRGLSPQKVAGFDAAVGAASKTGNNAQALAAMRQRLGPAQRAGFDHGIRTIANRANPNWVTVVKGGKVLRGNFRKAAKGAKGSVSGRAIINGKVQVGTWVR